jgi:hypothetical protein
MHRLVRRLALLPSILVCLVAPAIAAPPARAADEFPKGWRGYHTYPEMVDEIKAVAAAHPDIVDLFSIGESYRGRELLAAKVSDNVLTDETEPEVLYDGLHHADEHMGLEMTLRILGWLTDGYGSSARITSIVNTREIWIVFAMNPDGAQFDIKGGRFHYWRKNRQPTPGSSAIGTDLNRNYGYRWGLGGRTSDNPAAITYHGPRAFSAPETRAMRDFLASRIVGGRQQIRAAITFHEAGRLVMWPYGYTKQNVPPDMTSLDRLALRDIGRHMARTNGYTPEQASDLYISHGTSRDYAYGAYRIFSYTFELSVRDYPKTRMIAPETGRNKEAVLWLAERAWCPLSVLGESVRRVHCGALDDDFEVARGWTVDPDGTDTAPASGRFARGNPEGSTSGGVSLQPSSVTSGRYAFVTGLAAGSSAGASDLDGRTTIRSAPITLPSGAGQRYGFRYFFGHGANSSSADHLRAIVEDGGTQTVLFETTGSATLTRGGWQTASGPMDAWAGRTVRIRFEALDGGPDSTVEAGIDDIQISRPD